jgi:hypothetical protein
MIANIRAEIRGNLKVTTAPIKQQVLSLEASPKTKNKFIEISLYYFS